jgi:hypothetical protein
MPPLHAAPESPEAQSPADRQRTLRSADNKEAAAICAKLTVLTMRVGSVGCDKFNTTGKLLLIYGNRVKSQNQKYFAFPEMQIRVLVSPTRPARGAFRDRHVALGGAVMDALASGAFASDETSKRTAKSCGPGAAMLASSLWSDPHATVAKEPLTGESTK